MWGLSHSFSRPIAVLLVLPTGHYADTFTLYKGDTSDGSFSSQLPLDALWQRLESGDDVSVIEYNGIDHFAAWTPRVTLPFGPTPPLTLGVSQSLARKALQSLDTGTTNGGASEEPTLVRVNAEAFDALAKSKVGKYHAYTFVLLSRVWSAKALR